MRPAFWLGRLLWKGGDGKIIDGLGPDGIAGRVLWTTGRVVKLQTGYVYHYAFAMLIGVALHRHLVHVLRRSGAMNTGFGLLSLRHLLPAGRRARHRRAQHGGQGQRALDRALHDAHHVRRRRSTCGPASIQPTTGFQFVEEMDWLGGSINYKMGVDGISMLFVMLTAFLMPLCILASWESIETRVKEYMIAFLVLETLMIGVFCALDLVLFYLFFEGGLIPMFLIIGVWGGTRRVYASFKFFLYTLLGSVLMLLAMMAMYWHAGTTDIPTLLTHKFPARHAVVAVARLLRLVRGEDADVAGAHLAARRARRGADGGLGDPGRHPAEDGRLRLPALLAADVPAGEPGVRAAGVRALGHRHHLHLAGGAGAGGREEADRLFSVAHMGFVTMGIFSFTRAGRRRRHLPDAVARPRLGRAVPVRRRRLRPHAHARDRRLRRPRQPHAALRLRASWCSRWPTSACPARRASSASS